LLLSAAVLAAQTPELSPPIILLPPPPKSDRTVSAVSGDLSAHRDATVRLKSEYDALAHGRQLFQRSPAIKTDAEIAESARLRKRADELLKQLEIRKTLLDRPARSLEPMTPKTAVPVDSLPTVAVQFLAGQYEAALASLRRMDPATLGRDEKVLAQYLTAGCLRNLGKLDEAATLYRQVGNSGGTDEVVVDGAAAQVLAITARRDMTRELAEIRTRMQER
jgi:hypothetical protein